MFPRLAGGKIGLYWIWKEARQKTGLTDARLHDLRHSYATRALKVEISLPVIARLLGHSTVWTTSRYLHVSERVVEWVSDIEAEINVMIADSSLGTSYEDSLRTEGFSQQAFIRWLGKKHYRRRSIYDQTISFCFSSAISL